MMSRHLHNSMTPPVNVQNLPVDQAVPTVSLKAPIATDAILDSITDEPRLERVNRYVYVFGMVSTVFICVVTLGLYYVSR